MLMRCCYHVSLSRSSAIFPLLGKNLIENASDTMKNNGEERKTKRAVREGRHEERSETEFWGYPWSIWIQLCLMLTHPRTFHEPKVPSFLELVWLGLLLLQVRVLAKHIQSSQCSSMGHPGRTHCIWLWPSPNLHASFWLCLQPRSCRFLPLWHPNHGCLLISHCSFAT